MHRRTLSAGVLALVLVAPVAFAESDGTALEQRGTLSLPGAFTDADGRVHRLAETSGVAWAGDDRYVAAMDGSDRALLFRLSVDAAGAPLGATAEATIALDAARDWEDVAVVGTRTGTRLFLVEEETPALRVFLLDAGLRRAAAEGGHSLRRVFPGMRPNRGPEALSADPDGRWLWTANEEALAGDGGEPRDGVGGRVRLVRLPVPTAEPGRRPADPTAARREWIYEIDPPHARLGLGLGPIHSGLVALAALGEGRLLVLERSAGVGVPPFENRIYLVDPSGAPGAKGAADAAATPVGKSLLWRGALGVNLEGLCIGPGLDDGRRVVVGVADNAAGDRTPAGADGPVNPLVIWTITTP